MKFSVRGFAGALAFMAVVSVVRMGQKPTFGSQAELNATIKEITERYKAASKRR